MVAFAEVGMAFEAVTRGSLVGAVVAAGLLSARLPKQPSSTAPPEV